MRFAHVVRPLVWGSAVLSLLHCTGKAGDGGAPSSFVAGPFGVTAMGPAGEAQGPVQVYATFDKPVVQLGEMDDKKARKFLKVTPEKPGQYRFLGTQTVVFEFTGNAPRSTQFKAEVPAGSGATGTLSTTFSTLQLRLTDTSPGRNFSQAPNKPLFLLAFNQPVNVADLSAAVTFSAAPPAAPVGASCVAAPKDAAPNSYTCTATGSFPSDTAVTLTVARTLHGAEGPLGMAADETVPFRTHGPAGIKGLRCDNNCPPEYGARIEFLTPLIPSKTKGLLEVTPALTLDSDGDYPTQAIYLSGLKPSTSYTVRIKKGLKDEFGQELGEEKTLTFQTSAATPNVNMPARFLTMEPGATRLTIKAINTSKAQVELWRVGDAEAPILAHALAQYSDDRPRPPDTQGPLTLKAAQDQWENTPLDFAPVLTGGRGMAAFRIHFPEVTRYEKKGRTTEGFIQVTTLGITLKTYGDKVLVWVTQLANGAPVPQAKVTLMDVSGRTQWTGETDANGLTEATGINAEVAKNIWAVVRSGDDVALGAADFEDGLSAYDQGAFMDWRDGDITGIVFTDRGVYRPGEVVHLKAVVRQQDGGELKLPPSQNASLTLVGPTGDDVLTRKLKLSGLGTGHVSFNLEPNAPLGSYTLNVSIGERVMSAGLMVEQFRAPDFKVEVRAEKAELQRGEPLKATATASYLFGAPLAGANAKTTVNLVPTSFQPRQAPEGFTFEDDTRWLQDNTVSTSLLLQKEDPSDAQGAVKIEATVKADVMPTPVNAVIEVTAVDPSGQSITGTGSVLVHPAAHYLGLRTAGSMVKAGESFAVDAVSLNPDGAAVASSAEAILRRREYKAVQQQGVGDSSEALNAHDDKEVARCALAGLGKEPRSCTLKALNPGLHLLSVEGKDQKGNPVKAARVVWVFGAGEAPWLAEETLAVKMVTDKKGYKVGDTARILVQNPFPGARALVTVERGTVSERKTLVLEGNAPTLEVPITDAFVPNMFIGVVVVRGRTGKGIKDGPAVRAGYAQLVVDPSVRRLAVSVTPNAAEYGPRDKVTVNVGLKDASGAATSGEVALFVVDESVLQLTGFKTPDPIPTFYAPRGISVRTADNRIHLVDMRSYGEKGEDEGGGGLGALLGDEAVRGRFLTCAYFNPAIKVPATGTAEVSFELPDNLTSFRLMALAVGDNHRFGSVENSLRVKKPLILRPARPRLVRVGDDASVGVVAVNGTGAAGSVEFLLENKTPELADVSAKSGTVTAENGASVPWRVSLKAKKSGTVVLRVAGKLGAGTDSVEMKIPVTEPMPLLHDATYGSVEAGKPAVIPLAAPKDARPNMGGLTVSLATTLLSGLSTAAMQLRSYPYDCAEQTASKLLPYVELGAMRDAFGLANAAEFDALSTAATNKLLGYQAESGGFSFWSGGQPNPWLTAYAALVLSRAQAAGLKIPATALHRAQGFLKQSLKGWEGATGSQSMDNDTAALVVDVLATLKDPVHAAASRLFELRQTLRAESKALLLHALALNGSARDVKPLADEMAALVHQSPSGAMVQLAADQIGWLGSATRTHALVLRALVAAGTHNVLVEKLALGMLARQVKGSYRTTQEAAWALLAVREYQQAFEKTPPDLKVTASVGGKEMATGTFDKPSLQTVVGTLPLDAVSGGALTINASGTGTVRYGATFSYAPATMPSQPLERGMFVERRLLLNKQPMASKVTAGQLMHLVVEVSTPMDRQNVVADIPVPAGLELVNARLATSETVPSVLEDGTPAMAGMEDENGEIIPDSTVDPLLQGHFDHVELRDDRLLLFATQLPRGVHRYVVGVRSVTPGTYVLPPPRVEEMYTPEVFGQGVGGTFTVEQGKP